MLNIRTRAAAEKLTFNLVDQQGEPLLNEEGKPCTCTVYGPGSRRHQLAQQVKMDKLSDKKFKSKDPTAEQRHRMVIEFLADITESIDIGYDDLEGREKLLAIYSDCSVAYIADQVIAKATDWANFKPGSVTS